MRMVDLIHKKKTGLALTPAEINEIISRYTAGEIPDYQMAAWLMAVYFRGLNREETAQLTQALVNSGDQVDLSAIRGIKVDKHSTGGVGDKISLIIIPLVAAKGVPIAKMSGRGLGHTGGTIDKLESIAGFQTNLTREQFIHYVDTYQMAIAGQTDNLTPADKKMYALRDVTATVDSIPLIAASVMSKKIAAGADAIVLDVKVGSGAFMKTLDQARELARTMVDLGNSLQRKTRAVLTDMSQPLGRQVGNANEVREAIEVLQGRGQQDLTTVALTIAAQMAVLGGVCADDATAYRELEALIQSGAAIASLKQLVQNQGGDPRLVDHPELLPQAKEQIVVTAPRDGYVATIDAEAVGTAAMRLGAGRRHKNDVIDYAAGLTLLKKVGEKATAGEPICLLLTNNARDPEIVQLVQRAYGWSDAPPPSIKYIHELIR